MKESIQKAVLERKLGKSMWKRLIVPEETDSTNAYLKRLAADGAEEGTAVIAMRQTAGRGRRGRTWSSETGGIYLSCLLQPQFAAEPEKIPVVSLAVGLAAYKAVLKICGAETGIKWPNDVVYDGRKVCGILSELCAADTGIYCVAGIGINVRRSAIPEELRERAVSLEEITGQKVDKNELTAQMLKEIEWEYRHLDTCVRRYAAHCITVGKEVRVLGATEEFDGAAVGIAENGGLIVRKQDGTQSVVSSGEVSVRGIYGYV